MASSHATLAPTAARRQSPAAPVMPAVLHSLSITPLEKRVRRGWQAKGLEAKSARLRELAGGRLDAGRPLVAGEGNASLAYRLAKRAFDVVGALGLLVMFAPIMFVALVVLTITTQGRPFFVQQRIGYRGRKFPMIKFRTMRLDADRVQTQVKNEKDGPIFKNRRDPRVTCIGRFLRSTSIDEMPQLVNVLLGHMALVGPRPPVEKEVRQYEPWQHRRLSMRLPVKMLKSNYEKIPNLLGILLISNKYMPIFLK